MSLTKEQLAYGQQKNREHIWNSAKEWVMQFKKECIGKNLTNMGFDVTKLPIHTNDYSVTDGGISFDGYYLSKIVPYGYFLLTWRSGYTQILNKQTFDSIEGVEHFLSNNNETLTNFKKINQNGGSLESGFEVRTSLRRLASKVLVSLTCSTSFFRLKEIQ